MSDVPEESQSSTPFRSRHENITSNGQSTQLNGDYNDQRHNESTDIRNNGSQNTAGIIYQYRPKIYNYYNSSDDRPGKRLWMILSNATNADVAPPGTLTVAQPGMRTNRSTRLASTHSSSSASTPTSEQNTTEPPLQQFTPASREPSVPLAPNSPRIASMSPTTDPRLNTSRGSVEELRSPPRGRSRERTPRNQYSRVQSENSTQAEPEAGMRALEIPAPRSAGTKASSKSKRVMSRWRSRCRGLLKRLSRLCRKGDEA
ncbi:hypothetical protein BJ508DRAFT_372106 [Ascobolus immersus RN42]|uniref:Uncharacterized protein n=1 Tax=Ascobolus immersus RN42 TaxID=1160509 RepID=A0A3N4ILE6_ASCIM|nr:hypothetical protein BJ508DRAFT_372106 [Ascobolus immersus RN42]